MIRGCISFVFILVVVFFVWIAMRGGNKPPHIDNVDRRQPGAAQVNVKPAVPAGAPLEKPQAAETAPQVPVVTWLDSSKGEVYEENGVVVKLDSYGHGRIPLDLLSGAGQSDEVLAVLTVKLTNNNPQRKAEYGTWRDSILGAPRMKDEFGNEYRLVHFGIFAKIVGSIESADLRNGIHVSDELVFQRPVPAATTLFVELPARAFGGNGTARFKIPAQPPVREEIRVEEKPKANAKPKASPPPAAPVDKESVAATRLHFIRDLIKNGKTDKARERIKELVAELPETKAAKEAKTLLDDLDKK